MRLITGVVGAVHEAWAELRIHRTRVLLSLIGVAVAVAALTTVVGLGSMAQQATTESLERQTGRPAMLSVNYYSDDGTMPDSEVLASAFQAAVDRYEIGYSSRNTHMGQRVQFVDGVYDVQGQAVDVDYATMHRLQVLKGNWFTEADEQRLAPGLIVNEIFWQRLGSPDLRTHPTVTLEGESPVTAVVIGVTAAAAYETEPSMMMLYSALERITPPAVLEQQPSQLPQLELWVPPEVSDELSAVVQRDMTAALGDGMNVEVSRQDYQSWGGEDTLLPLKLMVGGVAILVLLLGALGLVNIALVTVRQRIREIGIRRSFGATAGRVFFSVMMESVVASFVAGVVGVMIAILIVQNPQLREVVSQGVMDLPPFPVDAALIGLAAATLVGALAGLLPALVAVRVKVIDAIRF